MRVLLFLCLFLVACGGGGGGSAPAPSSPAKPEQVFRKDLLFGYFGTWDGQQLAETAAHVNLVWIGASSFASAQIEEARTRKVTQVVLDVGPYLYTQHGDCLKPDPTAPGKLRTLFSELDTAQQLDLIIGLYTVDEPDKHCLSPDQVTLGNSVVRTAASEVQRTWPLLVIYGTAGRPGLADYDIIGEDAYQEGARAMERLDSVPPDKRLLLVPGGACPWQNDLQPFYDRAQSDSRVFAVIAFVWPNQYGGTNECGIRSAASRAQYEALGTRIKEGR
jgi:hypothetical protein